jgi:uncharacterized membrane protein YgdD (TMEM256/DUF423 family)
MIRAWRSSAAVVGFLSVAAGAIVAHLAAGDRTAELLRTGALCGLVHAAALTAVTAMVKTSDRPSLALITAGWGFAVGTLLFFSISLFGLALTGITQLGLVTPVGGASLLGGWAALGLEALRRR